MTKEIRRRVNFLLGKRFDISLRSGPKNGYFVKCEIQKIIDHMEGDMGFHLFVNVNQINEGCFIQVSDFILKNDKKFTTGMHWRASQAIKKDYADCTIKLKKLLVYVGVNYPFVCVSKIIHVPKEYFD